MVGKEAESSGKGRDAPDFKPRGAREVRRAAQAFMEMRQRIERAMEQRTAMLAGRAQWADRRRGAFQSPGQQRPGGEPQGSGGRDQGGRFGA